MSTIYIIERRLPGQFWKEAEEDISDDDWDISDEDWDDLNKTIETEGFF
jgi:hypothetical protein